MNRKTGLMLIFLLVAFVVIPASFAMKIELVPGWNFVGAPVSMFSIDSSNCGAKISVIYHYSPAIGEYSAIKSLDYIQPGRGYWLYLDSNENCELTFSYDAIWPTVLYHLGDSQDGKLVAGWNQISGTTSPVRLNPSVLDPMTIANRGDCDIVVIWAYNPKTKEYFTVDTIKPGKAYWVYVKKDCRLSAEPVSEVPIYSYAYFALKKKCSSHYDCESRLCSDGLCAPASCSNTEYDNFHRWAENGMRFLPLDSLSLSAEHKKFIEDNNIRIFSYSFTFELSEIDSRRASLLDTINEENRINYLVDYLQLLPSKDYLPNYLFITYRDTSLLRLFCGYGLDVYARVTAPSFRKSPVVLHEAGHLFVERFFGNEDISGKMHEFISISWDLKPGGNPACWSTGCEDYVPKPGLCADQDEEFCRGFMSTYSLSNPDEDFAESFMFYIAYGDFFRELSKTDEIAKKKYEFMKTNVFKGREYTGSPYSLDNLKNHYMMGQRWSLIYSDEKKALIEFQKALADLKTYSAQEENKQFTEYSDILRRTVMSFIKLSCSRSSTIEVQEICNQYDLSNVNVLTEHDLYISDMAHYE